MGCVLAMKAQRKTKTIHHKTADFMYCAHQGIETKCKFQTTPAGGNFRNIGFYIFKVEIYGSTKKGFKYISLCSFYLNKHI